MKAMLASDEHPACLKRSERVGNRRKECAVGNIGCERGFANGSKGCPNEAHAILERGENMDKVVLHGRTRQGWRRSICFGIGMKRIVRT